MNIDISIIIVSKNSLKSLPACLSAIKAQDFDLKKIEILLVDGGSTDGTIEYARANGVNVVEGGYADNQEARRYVGINKAVGDLLIFLDTDNIIPEKNWIKKMVKPFQNSYVGCSFTKWYGISKSMSNIDRYYALIGGNDSVSYYLNKNDRVPLGCHKLPVGAELVSEDAETEYVRFNSSKIPTLGCNGFVVRANIAKKLNYKDPEMFMHIDANVDYINNNLWIQYAIVKTHIYHDTGKNLLTNLKKRIKYKSIHSDGLKRYRKYCVYDKNVFSDNVRLFLIILIATTLVVPILRACYGFIKTKKIQWFYHPIDLIALVGIYGYSVIKKINS